MMLVAEILHDRAAFPRDALGQAGCPSIGGQMDLGDRAFTALNLKLMRREQYLAAGESDRRVELPARKFDQKAERVLEIDCVEDHSIADARVLDPARVKPLDRLHEEGAARR
jgi:hypothetical protein